MNEFPQDVKSYTQWKEKFNNWEKTNENIRRKNREAGLSGKPDPAFFDHNEYSAMSAEERKNFLNTKFGTGEEKSKRDGGSGRPRGRKLAAASDWSSIAGPVEDQKQCGSCYSFAASHALSSAFAKAGESWSNLSEQHIVDCTYSNNVGGNHDV